MGKMKFCVSRYLYKIDTNYLESTNPNVQFAHLLDEVLLGQYNSK